MSVCFIFLYNIGTKNEAEKFLQQKRRNIRRIEKENIVEMKKKVTTLEISVDKKAAAIRGLLKEANVVDVTTATAKRPIKFDSVQTVYCAVLLRDAKRMVAVPTKWIKNFDAAKMLNKGINASTKELVFVSRNHLQEADFKIPHCSVFSESEPGVYIGNVLRFFGM